MAQTPGIGSLTFDDFADVVVKTIAEMQRPLVEEIARLKRDRDELRTELLALEATAVKFQGVYRDTVVYVPGDAATRGGGLWICTAATTGSFDFKCCSP